jgi:hypothetical protein
VDVLFTGGCGDVIALESMWSEAERGALHTVYWATRAAGITRPLFERSLRYAGVDHVVLPYMGKTYFNVFGVRADFPALPAVKDWSILTRFREFSARPWSRSTFVSEPVIPAPICADLPDRFVVIQHETLLHTNAAQRQLRNLDGREWDRILHQLEVEDLAAVVVNGPGSSPPPRHPRIVDLVGRGDFADSMAILRRASGYWGIASALCVAAAQLFGPDALWVKGPESWLKHHRHIYFAPHRADETPFLFDHLCNACPYRSDPSVETLQMRIMRHWRNEIVAPGSIIEASPDEAEVLKRTGQAVAYDAAAPLRTAALKPPGRKAVAKGA